MKCFWNKNHAKDHEIVSLRSASALAVIRDVSPLLMMTRQLKTFHAVRIVHGAETPEVFSSHASYIM